MRIHSSYLLTVLILTATATASQAQWTPWLDRDAPSGKGDYETFRDFQDAGLIPCAQPDRIQCQTLDGVDFSATGQAYLCTPEAGGVCVNAEQPDGADCLDYRVRFRCGNDLTLTARPPKVAFFCGRNQSMTSSVTLDISGGAEPYTCYGSTVDSPIPTAGKQCVVPGLPVGTHTFNVVDASGEAASVQVEIEDIFTTPKVTTDCDSGTASVSATSDNGPVTYRWNPPINMGVQTVTGQPPGTYQVFVTDPLGCSRTVEVILPSPGC